MAVNFKAVTCDECRVAPASRTADVCPGCHREWWCDTCDKFMIHTVCPKCLRLSDVVLSPANKAELERIGMSEGKFREYCVIIQTHKLLTHLKAKRTNSYNGINLKEVITLCEASGAGRWEKHRSANPGETDTDLLKAFSADRVMTPTQAITQLNWTAYAKDIVGFKEDVEACLKLLNPKQTGLLAEEREKMVNFVETTMDEAIGERWKQFYKVDQCRFTTAFAKKLPSNTRQTFLVPLKLEELEWDPNARPTQKLDVQYFFISHILRARTREVRPVELTDEVAESIVSAMKRSRAEQQEGK